MKKRGYLINSVVLLLLIPLLLIAATYTQISENIIKAQNSALLLKRNYFNVVTIEDDLRNIVSLSFKRAYLTLTEYVTENNFVPNASKVLKELVVNGTINGIPQKYMENITLREWCKNMIRYLEGNGVTLYPNDVDVLLNNHIKIEIAPIDAFDVAIRIKIENITIVDASGKVKYSGDIPQKGYIFSIVSVVGLEDPFIVRELRGVYTRVIEPCRIPYPGSLYGYYDANSSDDIEDLVLTWCYLGLPANSTLQYPTILERFEGSMRNHKYYVALAENFTKELGIQQNPLGLVTFLVPSPTYDPELIGALVSVGASDYSNCTRVGFYLLKCSVDGDSNFCIEGHVINADYPEFKLDNVTENLVFGG